MSLEDLERRGLLLPRDQWGRDERSEPARWPIAATLLLQAGGGVAAYLGDGNAWTWIGLGAFLVALAAFTVLSVRAAGRADRKP